MQRAFLAVIRTVTVGVVFGWVALSAGEPPNAANLLPALAQWTYWAPRPELAQEHAVVAREGVDALLLRTRDFASYGYWHASTPVTAGRYYRFFASRQVDGLAADGASAFAVLTWFADGASPRELQRDYVDRVETAGPWQHATRTVRAPDGAQRVRVEVGLRREAAGAVYWRDVRLQEVATPAPRLVRIATTRLKPSNPATIEANTKIMADAVDAAGAEHPDLLLLSENFNTRSVRMPLAEKAQTIPGPLTEMLAAKARKYGMHIVTTLPERDGRLFHNTAVWIDRSGRIAGKYHKVHLTIGEMESGLTPGSEYPVFELDIGRVGIVTCWDNWFSEPMRILALRGAEIVLMPLAGDGGAQHWESVWRTRAMDNGVYLATSSTVGDSLSRIIDPTGTIVAETAQGHVMAQLDLNAEWRLKYLSVASGLGEARSLYFRERRPDTYQPLLHDTEARSAATAAAAPATTANRQARGIE